jgi:hypothetical protein
MARFKGKHAGLATSSASKARRNALGIIRLASCQPGHYQRRNCCCICRFGETDGGGLATVRVEGSTIGMALRVR